MNCSILIVEDETGLVLTLQDRLESEGYSVASASNGIQGEEKARSCGHDLIILDIMLPGRDGFQVCQNLRRDGIPTPILMLTARSTNIDTVMGLKIGADDFLTKPFDMQVLLARIEALLRRSTKDNQKKGDAVYQFGDFTLDTKKQQLLSEEKPVPLNAQEFKLLKYLLENADRTIGRDELLDEVWGYDAVTTTRTVDVHVAWLRQKLNDKRIPRYIQTLRGFGYRFISEQDALKP